MKLDLKRLSQKKSSSSANKGLSLYLKALTTPLKRWRLRQKKVKKIYDFDRTLYKNNSHILDELPTPNTTSATEAYNQIVAFTTTASENCWTERRKPPWMSDDTKKLLADRYKFKGDPMKAQEYSDCCREARESLRKDIETRNNGIIENAIKRGRGILSVSKDLSFKKTRLLMKSPDGSMSQTITKRAVQSFYNSLYSQTVAMPPLIPEETEIFQPFQLDEVFCALASLKLGHSPGPDCILPDMISLARQHLAPMILKTLNGLADGEAVPDDLLRARVKLLFKKGDSTDISNFRPIALTSVVQKTITRIILKRIENTLNEHESNTQTGFRSGYSVLDNLQCLQQVLEKSREYRVPLYLAFVDFKKAFDCVEWGAVWTQMATSGVHPTLIKMLMTMYEKTRTEIDVNGEMVEVQIRRGVKQGDTLSPKLFNLVLRSVMDRIDWEESGIRMNGELLRSIEYADDVLLFASNRTEIKQMLEKLSEAAREVGLEINAKKTVLMSSCTTRREPIQIGEDTYKFSDSTKYLGCSISLPMEREKEIQRRVQSGWLAWSKLSRHLTNINIPIVKRRNLFNSCISSVVLYGCELWALRECDRQILRTTQHKMERRMLKITRLHRWSNKQLREATGVKDWVSSALRRKFTFADKIRKMDNNKWTKKTTEWIPYNFAHRRSAGRPPPRWRDDLKKIFGRNWWSMSDAEWSAAIHHHENVT